MSSATPELAKAWSTYHATLEELRLIMERTPRFQDTPQHRAKAYHTLMEMQAMAYNFAVAPRMRHPRIYVNCGWQTDLYTLGQNGQDFLYGVTFLDGRHRYRLKGRMGAISLFLLQTLNGLFGEEGVKATGNYDWADFDIQSDGSFEAIISAAEEPGNWIRLDPDIDYQFIIIRRALVDWHGDPGELYIERINDASEEDYEAEEFDESVMATRIRRATAFVHYLVESFNIGLYDMYLNNAEGRKNVLTLLPGTVTSEVGSPSSNYAMAVFELEEDEALLIEMDRVPDGVYWSFQLGNVWSRSMDFSTRQSSLNNREVAVDSDGRVRIVVSHQDPGVNNWLDTCAHVEGTLVFRNYRALAQPVPESRKVKLADIDSLLPEDTARITPAERDKLLEQRRLGQRKLLGE